MALLQERKKFGVSDRLLTAFDTKVDGQLAASGPLLTKWADPTHMESTQTCVEETATPTEFCFKGKMCYLTFTLCATVANATPGATLDVEVFGSNDGFATEFSLGKLQLAADSEGYADGYVPFNNEALVSGVKEELKDIRLEATVSGGPFDAMVGLTRGMC